jgi:hypothetical protein
MQQEKPEEIDKTTQAYYKKWMLFAPIGLLLIGAGLCIFGTALFKMRDNAAFINWFMWGTTSLIVINAGICFFGSAVKYSILYELTKHKKER